VRARWSLGVAWTVALAVLWVAAARLLPVVRDQLAAPFDLISEGPHMSTIKAIWRGFDIYARESFLDLPFFMTPYTPLYHAIVAVLPQDATNPFFTGRVVAAVGMALAAAALFAVAERGHRATAALALGVFFLIHAVTGNTAYLRSDSLAIACSIWAVVVVARACSRRDVVVAAVLAALAVAGKQSFLAAGLVCTATVAVQRPRDLLAFLGAGLTVGAVLGAAATLYFGVDFWFAVTIPLSDYPRDWESYRLHRDMMLAQPVFLWIAAAGAVATIAAVVQRRWRLLLAPYLPYAIVSWVLQNAVMTGIGAENHNLIEPVLATLLWIVVAAQSGQPILRIGVVRAAALASLAWCVSLELQQTETRLWSFTDPAHTARYVRERAAAQDAARRLAVERGRMLNLKNSQVPHDFDGDMVLNDLWMYATVLWTSRPETVDRLVQAIEEEAFDVVIVAPGVVEVDPNPSGPWPRISRAVFGHYRLAHHGGEVNLLTRRR
jgi:hypothetical protein